MRDILHEIDPKDRERIRCCKCGESARYSEMHRSVIPNKAQQVVISFFYWCLACALEAGLPTPRWTEKGSNLR